MKKKKIHVKQACAIYIPTTLSSITVAALRSYVLQTLTSATLGAGTFCLINIQTQLVGKLHSSVTHHTGQSTTTYTQNSQASRWVHKTWDMRHNFIGESWHAEDTVRTGKYRQQTKTVYISKTCARRPSTNSVFRTTVLYEPNNTVCMTQRNKAILVNDPRSFPSLIPVSPVVG